MTNIILPTYLNDGRIDIYLKLIGMAKAYPNKEFLLHWEKTNIISPAGLAIISCIFDTLVEQKIAVKNRGVHKDLAALTPISNIRRIHEFLNLPEPNINNFEDMNMILKGVNGGIDTPFSECLSEKFSSKISEDILYSSTLIINELMQNSADHSTAERYYLYAGLWKNEFHAGLLDMGTSIPAKLEQKYVRKNDLEYLELSFEKGSGTRRQRTGGFGLYYFFEFLKENEGKLTIVSRGAQIRRYFKTRRSQKNILKYPLPGTWCFARFLLEN